MDQPSLHSAIAAPVDAHAPHTKCARCSGTGVISWECSSFGVSSFNCPECNCPKQSLKWDVACLIAAICAVSFVLVRMI